MINFGKYDTEILIKARRYLENVFSANYKPSSRQSALLAMVISKLDRLIKEYGDNDEVAAYLETRYAYFGKIDDTNDEK